MIKKILSLFFILLAVGAELGSAQTAAKKYYLVDGLFFEGMPPGMSADAVATFIIHQDDEGGKATELRLRKGFVLSEEVRKYATPPEEVPGAEAFLMSYRGGMGDVTPSGKLPFTFPAKLEDCPAHSLGEYTGVRSKGVIDIRYNESIFVGYRWADKQKKVKPLFPFGHGLSYTTFEYGKPTADSKTMQADGTLTVRVSVKNTGTREGQEVVQLYISDKKSSLPRPIKELKGFRKVRLAPGEEKEVVFTIDKEALSYFDDARHAWVAEPGKFEAIIAASAADIRGTVPFELQ